MIFTILRIESDDATGPQMGVRVWVSWQTSQGGVETERSVYFTWAEIQGFATRADFLAAVGTKLDQKLRFGAVAAKLNALIGQQVTI